MGGIRKSGKKTPTYQENSISPAENRTSQSDYSEKTEQGLKIPLTSRPAAKASEKVGLGSGKAKEANQ